MAFSDGSYNGDDIDFMVSWRFETAASKQRQAQAKTEMAQQANRVKLASQFHWHRMKLNMMRQVHSKSGQWKVEHERLYHSLGHKYKKVESEYKEELDSVMENATTGLDDYFEGDTAQKIAEGHQNAVMAVGIRGGVSLGGIAGTQAGYGLASIIDRSIQNASGKQIEKSMAEINRLSRMMDEEAKQ